MLAMKMQNWVPFVLLSICKIIHIAVNRINILRSSYLVPRTVIYF